MFKKADRKASREKRHLRVRKKVFGTTERPRLSVYRSEKNIYAQIIDDVNAVTVVAASSLDKTIEKGITEVVFDRGGYVYHGRIQALADGAREAGLKF